MTEERSRSPGQKLVQKQLSDFCQCLETGALIAVSCNANHPACHTSSKICFAPVFLFPRPEYCGLVIVTFSLVTSNCYVTAHQLFKTICLPGVLRNRHEVQRWLMVIEVCNYGMKQYFHSGENLLFFSACINFSIPRLQNCQNVFFELNDLVSILAKYFGILK